MCSLAQATTPHMPNRIAEYWVRIPVKSVRGGLWIGLIKPYEPIPTDVKICGSKLYKKDNRWFLDVVVEKDIPEKLQYQNVIGIDTGIRHIATSVELANGLTKFYGKDFNRVRGGSSLTGYRRVRSCKAIQIYQYNSMFLINLLL